MRKTCSWWPAASFPFAVLALVVLVLATLPLVFQEREGRVQILGGYLVLVGAYLRGLATGVSTHFFVGDQYWQAFEDLPRYFITSLAYAAAATTAGLVIGVPAGMAGYRRIYTLPRRLLAFLGTIPDFFLIMVLQLLVVTITQATGVRLAYITMATSSQIPVTLPLIAMSLYPAIYLIRSISSKTLEVSSQEYILFAKARGLSRWAIFRGHILPGIIPQLEADAGKITTMVMANLFIAEQLFLLKGITRIMFYYGFQVRTPYGQGGYQFFLVANCLLALVVLYFILRAFLGFLISLARRAAVHED
jgi:peptide/nickel transport system permease protein